ncbi:hypothetical protein NE686_17830 [Tissierella carlieri]|uniref:Uncharacterized protein n=1 Tax=Tissierella carlieri TaxID=689904 RepID=A0ABT1SEQ5_9FIRM|nr:hypothetical protein [Tissierella carlieri]MCQ4924965.1 hypothetical protein [Tissierella carlieri]
MENNNANVPVISIKTIERNLSKTYTDTESNINTLQIVADTTKRSFNDVIKELVNNFIENGQIFNPEENKYYTVKEIVEKYKSSEKQD